MSVENESIEVDIDEADIEEGNESGTPDKGEEPAGDAPKKLAGKYDNVDELEKAYNELQKKFSSRGGKLPTNDDNEESQVEPSKDGKIPAPKSKDESTGDDNAPSLDAALEEFGENGEVSEKTYEALKKLGLTKSHVDTFIAGQEALGERQMRALQSVVGGEEAFGKVVTWAAANLPADEQAAYNDALDSGNQTLAKMLLRDIKSQFDAAVGKDPSLVAGANTPAAGVKAFKSAADMAKAMDDPRYSSDPKYRKSVDERIGLSDLGELF